MPYLGISSREARFFSLGSEKFVFLEDRQAVVKLLPAAFELVEHYRLGVVFDEHPSTSYFDDLVDLDILEIVDIGHDVDLDEPTLNYVNLCGVVVLIAFATKEVALHFSPIISNLLVGPRQPDDYLIIGDKDGSYLFQERHEDPFLIPENQSLPVLKRILTTVFLEYVEAPVLHAAVLEKDGQAMLLLGGPGAGKSTLATALGSRQMALLSEDLAVVANSACDVAALRFPITLKSGSWPILKDVVPGLNGLDAYVREDGLRVKYCPIKAGFSKSLQPGWIIVLERTGEKTKGIFELPPEAVLQSLIDATWTGSDDLTDVDLNLIVGIVEKTNCYRLVYNTLDDAFSLLEGLKKREGSTCDN